MIEHEIDEGAQDRQALLSIHSPIRLGRSRAGGLLLSILGDLNAQAIDKKAEEFGFIGEMLVEGRPANHGLVAEHGDRHILVAMRLEQFGERHEQRTVRFLNTQIHLDPIPNNTLVRYNAFERTKIDIL